MEAHERYCVVEETFNERCGRAHAKHFEYTEPEEDDEQTESCNGDT